MEKKEKDFDVMKWLRKVRDDNHERLSHLPTRNFIRKISEEGEQTEFVRKLREKAAKRKP